MFFPTCNSLFLGFLFSCVCLNGIAQNFGSCTLESDQITTDIDAFESKFVPGAQFFINDYVLDNGATGHSRGNKVFLNFSYFQFRRPATPKEIKKGAVKGEPKLKVLEDGNVYLLRADPDCKGMFLVSDSFSGTFHRLPDGNIPSGMTPLNPYDLVGTALSLESWNTSYKSFVSPLGTIVFYDGLYQSKNLFESERTVNAYEKKKEAGRRFLGESLLITFSDSLARFSQSIIGEGLILEKNIDKLAIEVKDIFVGKSTCVIDFGKKHEYLVLNSASNVTIYDRACYEEVQKKESLAKQKALEAAKREKERILLKQSLLEGIIDEVIKGSESIGLLDLEEGFWDDHKNHFTLKSNNNGREYWAHEADPVGNLSVKAFLDSSGELHLLSYYKGDEWLFHSQLRFTIDTEKRVSSIAVPYSQNSEFNRFGTEIKESLYLGTSQDKDILRQIALNQDSEITVVFDGKKKDKTKVLSADEKKVIRDTYLYFLYLGR